VDSSSFSWRVVEAFFFLVLALVLDFSRCGVFLLVLLVLLVFSGRSVGTWERHPVEIEREGQVVYKLSTWYRSTWLRSLTLSA
jgi:hypothetical protein